MIASTSVHSLKRKFYSVIDYIKMLVYSIFLKIFICYSMLIFFCIYITSLMPLLFCLFAADIILECSSVWAQKDIFWRFFYSWSCIYNGHYIFCSAILVIVVDICQLLRALQNLDFFPFARWS